MSCRGGVSGRVIAFCLSRMGSIPEATIALSAHNCHYFGRLVFFIYKNELYSGLVLVDSSVLFPHQFIYQLLKYRHKKWKEPEKGPFKQDS